MGTATFFSRIFGLLREQVFAFLFGASHQMDAFNIAFRIPNLLRDLFAEGAMSTALVPVFVQVRAQQGQERAWRIAGQVFRVAFWGVVVLSLVGIFFSDLLVSAFAPSFHEIPGQFELTVTLTRVLFCFFPFVVLAAAFMAILNACGRYFLPAFAPALFNLVSVASGLCLISFVQSQGGVAVMGMAIGVVLGGVVQAFCQLPALYKVGYRYHRPYSGPSWNQEPALKRMLLLILPGTAGLAATQVNILINSALATSLGEGAVSWLNYAFRLMQFPIGILGVSLAAATLPIVSDSWVRADFKGARQTVEESLCRVMALNLPASFGLAALALPIVTLVFQYGRFSSEDTVHTAQALVAYSLGLSFYSMTKVLVPVFYAVGNTRLPVIASVVSVFVNIAMNLLLVKPLGYFGLALGTSVTALLNSLLLLSFFHRILVNQGESLNWSRIIRTFGTQFLISFIMGFACWKLIPVVSSGIEMAFSGGLGVGSLIQRILTVGVLIGSGILILFLLSWAFRVKDSLGMFSAVFRRAFKR